jgi:3-methyladenine DNA glycosylase/8-oxoguanine DNA glycosylase
MNGVPPAKIRSAQIRVWRPDGLVSVPQTLASLRRGAADPCCRVDDAGGVWRATNTPDGPALIVVRARPSEGELAAQAWGAGAAWALDGAPDLLGAGDDASGFDPAPEHPRLREALRRRPGWRVARTRAVFEALVPAALEQRVTGAEARDAWRRLVRGHGEPAPGPASEAGRDHPAAGMLVPPPPQVWRQISQADWLTAGVDLSRRRVVLAAAEVAPRLEETLGMSAGDASRRLRSLPGLGIWTSAEIRQRAHGDPDAFSFGDYHVAADVSWALTGQVMDDAGVAIVIERYRGHRYRVQRLLELDGVGRPRRGPRRSLPGHLPR